MDKKKTSFAIKCDRVLIVITPVIIATIAFFGVKYICKKYDFIVQIEEGIDNYKMMLDIWGTLLGFLITAVSILLILGDGKFINMIKATGHYTTILLSYGSCCIHLFIVIVLDLVCIFGKVWDMNCFAALCAFSVDTMLTVGFCLFFLFALVLKANR